MSDEVNPHLIEQLKRNEGLRLKPYRDSRGFLTIGYGTNLDAGIDEEEASYLLERRAILAAKELSRVLPWTDQLDPVRRSALNNMAYNLGVPGLLKFKQFLAAMQSGNWAAAKAAGINSLWAKQVGERATELMEQIVTGEYADPTQTDSDSNPASHS